MWLTQNLPRWWLSRALSSWMSFFHSCRNTKREKKEFSHYCPSNLFIASHNIITRLLWFRKSIQRLNLFLCRPAYWKTVFHKFVCGGSCRLDQSGLNAIHSSHVPSKLLGKSRGTHRSFSFFLTHNRKLPLDSSSASLKLNASFSADITSWPVLVHPT